MNVTVVLCVLIFVSFVPAFFLTTKPSPKLHKYDMNIDKMLHWVAAKCVRIKMGPYQYDRLESSVIDKELAKNFNKIRKWYDRNNTAIVKELQSKGFVTKELMCNIEDTRQMLYLMYLSVK